MNNIYNKLLQQFGKQYWWPIIDLPSNQSIYHLNAPRNEEDRLEICIGAILTQNTSWNNVEKSIKILKENNLFNIKNITKIPESELALLIKSSGYYNQKAKKIKELIKFLSSEKEINRNNLLEIWGIGKETADSILCYAFDKPFFVVDAYTKRIFSRLGFKENTYDELQSLVSKNIDSKNFNEFHALIVKLAKECCKKLPECSECPLKKECKFN